MNLEEMERRKKELQRVISLFEAEEKIKDKEYQTKYERLQAKKNAKKEKLELKRNMKGLIIQARDKEAHLDYEGALKIWEYIGSKKESKRIRQIILDGEKIEQTVVHGDYVDDRDTIVKDSVINKSNIGAGGKSKSEELREAKALLDDGIIDDDEFKQMKKEILGK